MATASQSVAVSAHVPRAKPDHQPVRRETSGQANLATVPASAMSIHDIIAPALETSGPFNRLVERIESGKLRGCDPGLALKRMRAALPVKPKGWLRIEA